MKKIFVIFSLCISTCSFAQTLTLDECVKHAVAHNRTLVNASLEIQASSVQQQEMRTKYLPQVSANVMAFYAFDKIVKGDGTIPQEIAAIPALADLAGQPFSIRELNRGYSATLSVMQPVYAGGQITTANDMARLGCEVAELQKSMQEKDVIQKVTENYWQIVLLKYNIRTIEAAEKQLTAIYKQVNDFVEVGVTTHNALLKVKLRQQELASNRLKVENGERVLLLLLAQQIGMADAKDFEIVVPDGVEAPELPVGYVYNPSTSGREELKLAGKAIEAQEMQVKLERGKCMPSVAVGLMGYHTGFGGLSSTMKNYVNSTMTNAFGLVTVSFPITAWLGGNHAIHRAQIKLQQLNNSYKDAQEKLRIDVESAWLNAVEAHKQIDIARTSVEEAEENLRMSSDRYSVGKETITELLDAETLNRQAHDQLSSAIATYQIRLADYKRKL